jgi:hypothetical protein
MIVLSRPLPYFSISARFAEATARQRPLIRVQVHGTAPCLRQFESGAVVGGVDGRAHS